MWMRATLRAVALATMLVATPAMAQDDDQDCDNIMDELKKLAERLMNTSDPKGVGPVCAATGQLLGIIKASREVAAECYDEGRKQQRERQPGNRRTTRGHLHTSSTLPSISLLALSKVCSSWVRLRPSS